MDVVDVNVSVLDLEAVCKGLWKARESIVERGRVGGGVSGRLKMSWMSI